MILESHIQKANLIMDLRSMGISCNKVLSAIEATPREIFLPSNFLAQLAASLNLPRAIKEYW